MQRDWIQAIAMSVLLLVPGTAAWGNEQSVSLKLGGKFCDLYQDAIRTALLKVEGVGAVDFRAKKGHVVVTGQPGILKPDQLKDAIDGVKGKGWYCEAKLIG